MTRYHIEYCHDEIGEEWSIWPNTDFPLEEEPYQPYSEDTESNMIMLCFETESLVEAIRIAEEKIAKFIEGEGNAARTKKNNN